MASATNIHTFVYEEFRSHWAPETVLLLLENPKTFIP